MPLEATWPLTLGLGSTGPTTMLLCGLSTPATDSYTPYYPPIEPYVLPRSPFEGIIKNYGIDLLWAKSHACPCVYSSSPTSLPGAADPQCQTCLGRGVYWDTPLGPFRGLITFVHMSPSPDEPGSIMSPQEGLITNAEPTLTIPWNAGSTMWQNASIYDLFIEINSTSRFNAKLQVGGITAVPYQFSLEIAPFGAVTVYDETNHIVTPTNAYTVSGATVTLTGFPTGTAYIVDFTAAPVYVAYRVAGAPPHVRPFGNVNLPRRFRLQTLDLWTRAHSNGPLPN